MYFPISRATHIAPMHFYAVLTSSNRYIHFRMRVFVSISTKTRTWNRCHVHQPFIHRRSLQWRHNECDGVSDHQPHDCLLNLLFRRRSKKTSKLRVTGFVRTNHRYSVNSQHKWPVTRKIFPFDDVIMHPFILPGIVVLDFAVPSGAKPS